MSAESRRHADFAAGFTTVQDGVTDWEAATPVPEWRAKDVVTHLLDWPPSVLRDWAGVDLADDPSADLSTRWRRRVADMQALLDDDEAASRVLEQGPFAGQTVAQTLDRLYTADVYMHTWDLARASGQQEHLDRDYAAEMLPGMQGMEQVLRSSGQFGDAAVPTDSVDPVDRLMAFIGRDPAWTVPRG